MRHDEAARRRASVVPPLDGVVLEIGIGSGLNLPYYGEEVARVVGVDSSGELTGAGAPENIGGAFSC